MLTVPTTKRTDRVKRANCQEGHKGTKSAKNANCQECQLGLEGMPP